MKTWTAWVTKTERYPVTVEAENYGEVYGAAVAVLPGDADGPAEISIHADDFVQLGEPWAYSDGWYDLHGPDDIIVVERSTGNLFTGQDIDLLGKRLTDLRLKVIDRWNGAGCSTASFHCSGRKGTAKMSGKDLAFLLAPRTQGAGEKREARGR